MRKGHGRHGKAQGRERLDRRVQAEGAADEEHQVLLGPLGPVGQEAGEVLAVLHANRAESVPAAEAAFLGALQWSDTAPEKQPLILGIVR